MEATSNLEGGVDLDFEQQIFPADIALRHDDGSICDRILLAVRFENLQILDVPEVGDSAGHIRETQPSRFENGQNDPHGQIDLSDRIPDMDGGLGAGDVVRVGSSVELEVLDTPGHTLIHICLLAHTATPALIAGDTIFNAGAGNCRGGDPEILYQTFSGQLAKLADNTRIFPGHDYFENNLNFTLDREPDNARAAGLLEEVKAQDPADPLITTIGLEKDINCFFRLQSATVIDKLREAFPDLPGAPDEKTVFLKLRELRNSW